MGCLDFYGILKLYTQHAYYCLSYGRPRSPGMRKLPPQGRERDDPMQRWGRTGGMGLRGTGRV